MSYKLRTLIVFDTNVLRSIEAGEVAYSFFAFGRPFKVVEAFIHENLLKEDIHLAIPTWAIEELKDQKKHQYESDISEYVKLTKRLSGMPHIPEIKIPEDKFDCATYIQEKAQEFLEKKEIKLLELKEELASTILNNMMQRVMKDENKKHPFIHIKKGNKTYKDAGFKDNLIWESLIHFSELKNYDKVIFLTADSDYSNCKEEFIAKWNKHFVINSDENNVIAELKNDYGNYIDERAIHDLAQTEYFKDYLFNLLKVKSEIILNDSNLKIENFLIVDFCSVVDRIPPTDDEDEYIIINSGITIHFTENGDKKQQVVIAKTTLADDETKEIIETTFEPELV